MIQPIGHFRVWRELYSKPIWLNSTLEQQVILMTLMAMANFKANQWEWEGQKYDLKPGQFITSSKSIIENTGGNVTIQNVRTALKRFEKLEFLTNVSTKRGRLITLVNWQDYQYVEEEGNQVTNREPTESQPRANRELTTIEEGKKDEKVNKEIKETDLQIKNLRLRYSINEISTIDKYLDILRWTRKNGKIADSVILGIYKKWEEFSIPKVIYALELYVKNPNYHDKKENYCYGIMRNASAEEVSKQGGSYGSTRNNVTEFKGKTENTDIAARAGVQSL